MLDILAYASSFFLGLFAGSLLTEAMILVPYWRRMPAADFLTLHHTLGAKLFQYFAPLTTITVVLGIVNAIFHGGKNWGYNLAGVLCFVTLAIFFIYFKKANQSFADQSLQPEELGAELARWSAWHWVRTVLILAALGASLVGLKS